MVYFTCNHCGGSEKKPNVEKHYVTKCKGAPIFVTCMDCQKDFKGKEYVEHTKCVSEAERYSGKDYVPKPGQNKGQKKQDSWIETLKSLAEEGTSMDPKIRNVFQRLVSYENVPRKKAKFQNFITNCFKIPMPLALKVWGILEQELEKWKAANKPIETKESQSEKENVQINNEDGEEKVIGEKKSSEEGVKSKKKKKKNKKKVSDIEEIVVDLAKEVPVEATTNGNSKASNKKAKRKGDSTDTNNDNADEEIAEPTKKKAKKNKSDEIDSQTNGHCEEKPLENGIKKKKLKKNKVLEDVENKMDVSEQVPDSEQHQNMNGKPESKFDWHNTIVNTASDGIDVEKLKKKVLKKYSKQNPESEINNKIEKTFKKYLKKSGLKIENDTIKIDS